jgi:hypothetical protein
VWHESWLAASTCFRYFMTIAYRDDEVLAGVDDQFAAGDRLGIDGDYPSGGGATGYDRLSAVAAVPHTLAQFAGLLSDHGW